MIKLKDIGRFEELPEIAMHIYQGNVPALQDAIAAGWDIEKGIVLSKFTTISPYPINCCHALGECRHGQVFG